MARLAFFLLAVVAQVAAYTTTTKDDARVLKQSTPGVTPCLSTCRLGNRPSCYQAKKAADSCASSCNDAEKDDLLAMADDQPCTFANANSQSETSAAASGSAPAASGSAPSSPSPDTSSDDDSDGGPPPMDVCMKSCDMKNQPTCAQAFSMVAPGGCASSCPKEQKDKLMGGTADGPCDHIAQGNGPPTNACMSTCDFSKRPSCAEAKAMASTCAVTCTIMERHDLNRMASDQPCYTFEAPASDYTGNDVDTSGPYSGPDYTGLDPSPSPGPATSTSAPVPAASPAPVASPAPSTDSRLVKARSKPPVTMVPGKEDDAESDDKSEDEEEDEAQKHHYLQRTFSA